MRQVTLQHALGNSAWGLVPKSPEAPTDRLLRASLNDCSRENSEKSYLLKFVIFYCFILIFGNIMESSFLLSHRGNIMTLRSFREFVSYLILISLATDDGR